MMVGESVTFFYIYFNGKEIAFLVKVACFFKAVHNFCAKVSVSATDIENFLINKNDRV